MSVVYKLRRIIRRYSILVICSSMLCSCVLSASYVHDIDSTPYGVDFGHGTWVLNDLDVPFTLKDKLTKLVRKELSKHLKDSLLTPRGIKNIALPYVPINPDTLMLNRLKNTVKHHYFINIRGRVVKNEMLSFAIENADINNMNITETILQIYDLNSLETIYSRRVIAKVKMTEDEDDNFYFVKDVNGMIVKSLKKILKKLKK
ncbi:hypothetical protein [Gelatiniphilus marinus]|uniref:Uncharacterized protein n=1 Tax=Gelatiniphilus marinus TaxID=1759464 RepID=A0ABW5JP26_9FLAO